MKEEEIEYLPRELIGRTYDQVKRSSCGRKEKKLMHQKWFLSFAQEQSRHFPSFLPEATSLNKATELIYCL